MKSKNVAVLFFGMCCLGVSFHTANHLLAEEVAIPGFVPGDTQPDTNPPAVRYNDGWLVPYEETIPGSDVTSQLEDLQHLLGRLHRPGYPGEMYPPGQVPFEM